MKLKLVLSTNVDKLNSRVQDLITEQICKIYFPYDIRFYDGQYPYSVIVDFEIAENLTKDQLINLEFAIHGEYYCYQTRKTVEWSCADIQYNDSEVTLI